MPEFDPNEYLQKERIQPEGPQGPSLMECAGEALRSAAWSAVQMPTEGITQLAEKITGQDMQPMQFIDAPQQHEQFGDLEMAQRAGAFVGTSILAVGLHKAVGTAIGGTPGALGKEMLQGGITGGVMTGVLMPSESENAFWTERVLKSAAGAAMFAGMAGVAHGTRQFALSRPDTFIGRTYSRPGLYQHSSASMGGSWGAVNIPDMLKSVEKK